MQTFSKISFIKVNSCWKIDLLSVLLFLGLNSYGIDKFVNNYLENFHALIVV